jgi:hypothetical protein
VMRWRFGCSWECDASVADGNKTHTARNMTAYFRLRVTLNKCCMTAVLAKSHDEFRALENRGSIFCALAAGSPILSEHVNRPLTETYCTTMKQPHRD